MLTRRVRCELSGRMTVEDGTHLSDGLMHDEVVDLAMELHGALGVISSRYSGEAIVDIVPHLINTLNRLDACLKTNTDLLNSLSDISNENSQLKKKLDEEKQKSALSFEESLNIEEQTESEIKNLRSTVNNLKKSEDDLKKQLNSQKDYVNSMILKFDEENISVKGRMNSMSVSIETLEADNSALRSENELAKEEANKWRRMYERMAKSRTGSLKENQHRITSAQSQGTNCKKSNYNESPEVLSYKKTPDFIAEDTVLEAEDLTGIAVDKIPTYGKPLTEPILGNYFSLPERGKRKIKLPKVDATKGRFIRVYALMASDDKPLKEVAALNKNSKTKR
ncbi:hypothetical protein LSTR_LSTR009310 [Laodelphax striatellus]|uniref:RH1 domain-containing protein n=1 Tax=Laodelphax striatellus TaxID=195883 RepID=A0A482XV66_LAOST|nr:hypothetical protein LSTR_LSTR009310 [Laodelphax striatellus]